MGRLLKSSHLFTVEVLAHWEIREVMGGSAGKLSPSTCCPEPLLGCTGECARCHCRPAPPEVHLGFHH